MSSEYEEEAAQRKAERLALKSKLDAWFAKFTKDLETMTIEQKQVLVNMLSRNKREDTHEETK